MDTPRLEHVAGTSSPELGSNDEQGLLRGVSRGDEAAFWELWLAHRVHLYSVCLRHSRGVAADAADAMSRSMLTAFTRLPAHANEIMNLHGWLTRLTRNVCIDMRREQLRMIRSVMAVENLTFAEQVPIDPRPTPEEAAAGNEVLCSLHRRIDGLPPLVREVARMRFLHEKTYDAIARELSITEATARKRVQQARTHLRLDGLPRNSRGLVSKETPA